MPGQGDFRVDPVENAALQNKFKAEALQRIYGVDRPNLGRTPESLSGVLPKLGLSTPYIL